MDVDAQKRAAAAHAATLVEEGMLVGLGSGSTAELAVEALGARSRDGLDFVGVATSRRTEQLARANGIRLTRLDQVHELDLTIDGADEVDPSLNLVKGRGGALLREKLVASAARRFVVVVDGAKLVQRLGERAAVPVEVVQFGWTTTRHRLQLLGLSCTLRSSEGQVYTTPNHNYILDCVADTVLDFANPDVGSAIKVQTGVVEHGLFLGMTGLVVVGKSADRVEVLEASL